MIGHVSRGTPTQHSISALSGDLAHHAGVYNRFLGLASVVRALHAEWRTTGDPLVQAQIDSLQMRIRLIRNMQALGVLAMIACVVSMAMLFFGHQPGGQITFVLSLGLMIFSLLVSFWEIALSGKALEILLSRMCEDARR